MTPCSTGTVLAIVGDHVEPYPQPAATAAASIDPALLDLPTYRG